MIARIWHGKTKALSSTAQSGAAADRGTDVESQQSSRWDMIPA